MLKLAIQSTELFNSVTSEIYQVKAQTIALEHSLISISKWEEKWEKPFLLNDERTREETIDYVRCMTLTPNVDPYAYYCLNSNHIQQIKDYINKNATATTIQEFGNKRSSKEIITSELIYCWMIQLGIPFECQKWHLNRLLTLIRVCSIKNSPQKKMDKRDVLKQYSQINAARRAAANSKG